MTRQTKSERDRLAAYHALAGTMRGLEEDLCWGLEGSLRIPHGWHEIARRPGQPAKRQVTIRLDEDVLAFFRAMGAGYLTRINAVLRVFMLARLAGLVTGPEDVRYAPDPVAELAAIRREILDHAIAETEAREAREKAASAREKLEGMRKLRDARLGK